MKCAGPIHDPAALTIYIEARFHARHRSEFPLLCRLARKVEILHFGDERAPEGLGDLLSDLARRKEAHMAQEERAVFPAIRAAPDRVSGTLMADLGREHDDQAAAIAGIRRLTSDLTVPSRISGCWPELVERLRLLVTDIDQHHRLERTILVPVPEGRELVQQ